MSPACQAGGAPLVRVEPVSKTYREGAVETSVLRGASLELARGETTSLDGRLGQRQVDAVSLLAGLMLPDSGSVVFDGHDITGLDETARARLRANRVGIVLQSGNLIPFLTAVENVELAIELAGGDRPATRARELLVGARPRRAPRPPPAPDVGRRGAARVGGDGAGQRARPAARRRGDGRARLRERRAGDGGDLRCLAASAA